MSGRDNSSGITALVSGIRAGKTRAIARAITLVESGAPERDALLEMLRPDESSAPRVIGITGPPGTGKSTLVSGLIGVARERGDRVAVLAVDPTSPFSGGALLGDRLRMGRHNADAGVYIRSMASRGRTGGLSPAALETVAVLTAAGFGTILVESVGVGQSEVGVLTLADLVVLVLNPGTGDEIQALKAGVMEIGDLYVVNKGDYPEADGLVRTVQAALHEAVIRDVPPVVMKTTATTGEGVPELYQEMDRFLGELDRCGALVERRRRRIVGALREIAEDLFGEWISGWIEANQQHGWSDPRGGIPFATVRRELAAALATLTATSTIPPTTNGTREEQDDSRH